MKEREQHSHKHSQKYYLSKHNLYHSKLSKTKKNVPKEKRKNEARHRNNLVKFQKKVKPVTQTMAFYTEFEFDSCCCYANKFVSSKTIRGNHFNFGPKKKTTNIRTLSKRLLQIKTERERDFF